MPPPDAGAPDAGFGADASMDSGSALDAALDASPSTDAGRRARRSGGCSVVVAASPVPSLLLWGVLLGAILWRREVRR
jgi:hypothetical protein